MCLDTTKYAVILGLPRSVLFSLKGGQGFNAFVAASANLAAVGKAAVLLRQAIGNAVCFVDDSVHSRILLGATAILRRWSTEFLSAGKQRVCFRWFHRDVSDCACFGREKVSNCLHGTLNTGSQKHRHGLMVRMLACSCV